MNLACANGAAGSARLSLIVPAYNEEDTLGSLLNSIAAQSVLPDEIIVINAGSTDDTPRILQQFEAHSPSTLRTITLGSAHPGQARNSGAHHSTGDILAFVDAGFVLDARWLEHMVAELRRGYGLVFGNWQVHTNSSCFRHACQMLYTDAMVLRNGRRVRRESVASMVMLRSTWDHVAPFSEEYPAGEDVLFLRLLLASGVAFSHSAEALSYWAPPESLGEVWRKHFLHGRCRQQLGLDKLGVVRSTCWMALPPALFVLLGSHQAVLVLLLLVATHMWLRLRRARITVISVGGLVCYTPLLVTMHAATLAGRIAALPTSLSRLLQAAYQRLRILRRTLPPAWAIPAREYAKKLLLQRHSPALWLAHRVARRALNAPPVVPVAMLIETTTLCNARCVMCPHTRLGRRPHTMSWELYEKILRDCARCGIRSVQLNGTNEPLLDPLILRRIDYAKRAGISQVSLYTNGSLLHGELAEGLLASQLDLLIISFDGILEEGFSTLREGLAYATVRDNTCDFLRRRQARGLKRPIVVIASTLRRSADLAVVLTSALYKELRRLANGVDLMLPSQLHDWAGQICVTGIDTGPRPASPRTPPVPCHRLWNRMSVHPNGDVVLCCLDYRGVHRLANLSVSEIRTVWHSPALADVRRRHVAGLISLCAHCREADPLRWLQAAPENIAARYV